MISFTRRLGLAFCLAALFGVTNAAKIDNLPVEPEFLILDTQVLGDTMSVTLKHMNTGKCFYYIGATETQPRVHGEIPCPTISTIPITHEQTKLRSKLIEANLYK
jgi:hypothetical protein